MKFAAKFLGVMALVGVVLIVTGAVAYQGDQSLRRAYGFVAGAGANDAVATINYDDPNSELELQFTTSDTVEYTFDASSFYLGAANTIVGEGTTDDAFESTISFGEPTADATLTLPIVSTTLGDFAVSFVQGGTAADMLDTQFFVTDKIVTVKSIDVVWGVAESTGSMDIMVERLQGTEACAAGDDLQTAVVDATATANTVTSPALTATTASLTLAAGNRLCVDVTATPNEITNAVVTVHLGVG